MFRFMSERSLTLNRYAVGASADVSSDLGHGLPRVNHL